MKKRPPSPIKSLDELEARADETCRPFRAHWEITYRCNLDCGHCYVNHSACPEEAPYDEVASALQRAGILFVVVSGGEPLVRKDWRELIESIRSHRMSYRILTNGTLLTPQDARFLRDTGASAVDISVYAPEGAKAPGGELLHDYITGEHGSLRKALDAIEMLRSLGMKVVVKSPLFALNFRYAGELRALAEKLVCGFVADTTFVRPAKSVRDGFREVTEKELEELFTKIVKLDRKTMLEDTPGNLCGNITCAAGRSTLRVQPDGTVTPCVALPMAISRARGDEIGRAWTEHPALVEFRALTIDKLPECKVCPDAKGCVRCPGMALEESGSVYGATPSTCVRTRFFTKLRKRAKKGR
jgi:radical SAM protein with 4Fe4S-binding SPASM domain